MCHIVPINEKENIYRVLTPVEAERLNGFDDNWTEGMPEHWRYFCMGNALVVGVIEQLGGRLKDLMSTPKDNGLKVNRFRKTNGAVIGPLDRDY